MKAKKFLLAMLPVAAGLLLAACSSDDDLTTVQQPEAPATVKTIPFTVTVSGNDGVTRATVDSDHKTLKFQSGDQLYIKGEGISGTLELSVGADTDNGTFTGDLTWTGEGTPADDLELTATLIGANNKGVKIDEGTGEVSIDYGTALLADVATAVKQYSHLTATSTFSEKNFALQQKTAFLNFTITLNDGTNGGTKVLAAITGLDSDSYRMGMTGSSTGTSFKFVVALASGTTLPVAGAKIHINDNPVVTFGATKKLEGKVYNVTKTVTGSFPTETEFVDLGLSVKWANINLGATAENVCGGYYLYGAKTPLEGTTPKTTFAVTPYYDTSKPNGWSKYGGNDNDITVLEAGDDAATQTNASWRMPTSEEAAEINVSNTMMLYLSNYKGKGHGVAVMSKKDGYVGNCIVFPATGAYPANQEAATLTGKNLDYGMCTLRYRTSTVNTQGGTHTSQQSYWNFSHGLIFNVWTYGSEYSDPRDDGLYPPSEGGPVAISKIESRAGGLPVRAVTPKN